MAAVPIGGGTYRSPHEAPMPEGEAGLYINEAADEAERKAIIREAIRQENFDLCAHIVVFLVYLSVFTGAMFLESSDTSSRFADHIRNMLEGGGPMHHHYMVLDRIAETEDVYDFLQEVFIPAFWDNNTDTNQALLLSTKLHPIDVSNRMIGAARIRQVRVTPEENCQVDPMFADYTITCFPPFSVGNMFGKGNEYKEPYGPLVKNGQGNEVNKYAHAEDPGGTGYAGSMGVYPSGGYMAVLEVNRTTANITVEMLKTDNFLGLQTRAVFVDFLVWNSNLGVYAVCRVAIEFGPTGTAASYLDISVINEQMLKPGGNGSAKDWCAFFAVIVVMLFVVYFLAEEAQELYNERLSYFMDGWNVLDWINMLLLIVAYFWRIMVWVDAGSVGGDLPLGAAQLEDPDIFTSIRNLASKAELVRLLHSFNAVLLWGKCVKYFRHLPILKELVKTVWDAFSLFVPLMTMFTIALIGFTMAYNIGFGDKVQELTTFTRAVVYLSRSFIRDVRLLPVYYITPIFGAFLILLFYVMLVMVGVQVLFAVMADAMYREKHHNEEEDEMHRDEPLEELMRELKKLGTKTVRRCCPWAYVRFIKKPMTAQEREAFLKQQQEAAQGDGEKMALKDAHFHDTGTESSYSIYSEPKEKTFTTQEIMLAIQHMSGRVLSEVQEVGIEIRSELHDVCERVAQMQMAVEELSWRSELVRREQEQLL